MDDIDTNDSITIYMYIELGVIDGMIIEYTLRIGGVLVYCYHPMVALMEYNHHVKSWASFPNLLVVSPRRLTEDKARPELQKIEVARFAVQVERPRSRKISLKFGEETCDPHRYDNRQIWIHVLILDRIKFQKNPKCFCCEC